MKVRRRYGEAVDVQLDKECERIMEDIRAEAKNYTTDCIYNIDETRKYQKMKPDRSLTTMPEYSRKKDKARITVVLICNLTGTDKLLIWFISKAKRPNCFKYERLDGLESIGTFWRYNDTAQMNHKIIEEYLLWFDQEMKKQGKYVLLLMDNFSAHEVAVEQLTDPLLNTKVKWLPLNATSVYQPLDQGIIQNWKAFTQQQFVTFMAQTFDSRKDLSKEMYVLKAIRQGISPQKNDVKPATIQNCQARSQAIDFGVRPLPSSDMWAESQP